MFVPVTDDSIQNKQVKKKDEAKRVKDQQKEVKEEEGEVVEERMYKRKGHATGSITHVTQPKLDIRING